MNDGRNAIPKNAFHMRIRVLKDNTQYKDPKASVAVTGIERGERGCGDGLDANSTQHLRPLLVLATS